MINSSPNLLFLTTIWMILTIVESTLQLSIPPNIQGSSYTLYSNSSTNMPSGSYQILFTTTYNSTPTVAFGINNFQMESTFASQMFSSAVSYLNMTGLSIQVYLYQGSALRKFSISYIAISNQQSIITIANVFTDFPNLGSGLEGYRTDTITTQYAIGISNMTGIPLLTGFALTSTDQFQVQMSIISITPTSFTIYFETTGDCNFNEIDAFVLIYSSTLLAAKNYYVKSSTTIYSNNQAVGLVNYTGNINNASNTIYLLALKSFSGITSTSDINFAWTIVNMSQIIFNCANLQTIQYSFFQIGIYTNSSSSNSSNSSSSSNTTNPSNTSSNSSNSSSSPNSSNSSNSQKTLNNSNSLPIQPSSVATEVSTSSGSIVPIIGGVVAGLLVLGIALIIYFKFIRASAIEKLPPKDSLREMPSLSL